VDERLELLRFLLPVHFLWLELAAGSSRGRGSVGHFDIGAGGCGRSRSGSGLGSLGLLADLATFTSFAIDILEFAGDREELLLQFVRRDIYCVIFERELHASL
jgi:hypothetical protein